MPSGEPSGQQEVGVEAEQAAPGRRIQGRGGRGPGRRDVTKVARGAAEQVLDTVVEVSPNAVGAVKRGSCRRPPSPGTSYAPSLRAGRRRSRSREAGICGRSTSPGLLVGVRAYRLTVRPPVLLAKCRDSGASVPVGRELARACSRRAEEFLKNLPEGVRILSGHLHFQRLIRTRARRMRLEHLEELRWSDLPLLTCPRLPKPPR